MEHAAPSAVTPVEDEKNTIRSITESKNGADVTTASVSKEDLSSTDGDDALKLAGAHAHHFDEKYFLRLRRKIDWHVMPILVFVVSILGIPKSRPEFADAPGLSSSTLPSSSTRTFLAMPRSWAFQ